MSHSRGAVRPTRLSAALPTWSKVALLSFGGPAGQIGVMHKLVVEEKAWVDEDRFLHAMSYCMLLPGPEAQQLATYLGWLLHGTRGGLIAGVLFIIPGLISIYVLSVLYAAFRDVAVVEALFYGLKPAVIAVVLEAVLRMGGKTLGDRRGLALAASAFVAIFFLEVPFPLIVLAAGVFGYWHGLNGTQATGDEGPRGTAAAEEPRRSPSADGRPQPSPEAGGPLRAPPGLPRPSLAVTARTATVWLLIWFVPVGLLAATFGRDSVFLDEAFFFSKAAVVTFGGAYAVLAYIAQQAVEVYQWLAPGEMLDGLGMAETTPGPLIQVVQFVGYMGAYRNPGALTPFAAGAVGSLVTAWVTFVPCFLFVFVGAPFAEALRGNPKIQGALRAIAAAIVGVVLNLAVWFALHTLFGTVSEVHLGPARLLVPDLATLDLASLALAAGAIVAMLRFGAGMLTTLGVAAAAGMAVRILGG